MSRERLYRSEAIVLRRQDFGEADRLLTLFTPALGKIRVVAKGARKPQSRKAGHIESFMRTKMLFARGRNLDLVTQAELVEPYRALREDLVRVTYASHAVELLDRFTAENDAHPELYQLLAEALGWLAETRDLLLTTRYYELRLLSLTGFQPQLFQCVSCATVVEARDQFFSTELGGVLCPDCVQADPQRHPISLGALKMLRYLQTHDYEACRRLRLKPGTQRDIEAVMLHYITYILERNLKSIDFMRHLRREANN